MLDLPSMTNCETVCGDDAIVVCACGFEDRTLALGSSLSPDSSREAIVLVYRNWHDRNRVSEVVNQFERLHVEVEQLDYDRFIPDQFGDIFYAALRRRTGSSVLLDVSTMSKMAILLSLEVCRELNVYTRLFYCEANEYGPTREQYLKAKANPGFPRPSIQVYSGVAGLARASRLSSVAMQQLIQEWPDQDNPMKQGPDGEWLPERTTSTLDYRETTEMIRELYWKLALNYRIILAPTGAKMQTVGAFIARAMHPDMHVEYPTPKGFLDFYSRGIGSKWIVDFGRLGDFVSRLREQDIQEHLTVAGQ
jgi:hypothetical protein